MRAPTARMNLGSRSQRKSVQLLISVLRRLFNCSHYSSTINSRSFHFLIAYGTFTPQQSPPFRTDSTIDSSTSTPAFSCLNSKHRWSDPLGQIYLGLDVIGSTPWLGSRASKGTLRTDQSVCAELCDGLCKDSSSEEADHEAAIYVCLFISSFGYYCPEIRCSRRLGILSCRSP